MEKDKSKPLFLFYVLVAYVFLQSVWWTYHLLQLNSEIYLLKSNRGEHSIGAEGLLKMKLEKGREMILGEGTVFLVLLTIGVIRIRSGFKKENALARQQKNFLLSITHELRSPLASAKLQLETIHKRDLAKEKQKEIIESGIADLDRINHLVENVLLTTNLEMQNFMLVKELGNLSEFVAKILNKFSCQPEMPAVIPEVQPGIIFSFDKNALESIINNLLENAVKYSEKDITVKLAADAGKIRLEVSDHGPGIPVKEKENIFKKFYRLQNEETRSTKGTGLGLYIVKTLVELHNGEIQLKDNTPTGSIFLIIFNNEK